MSKDVRLFGAFAVRPAVRALLPDFEAAAGFSVADKWELNPAVRRQIEAGEPFDLVITNPNLVTELVALNKIKADSQVPFGQISMGVAARAGGQPLELGSVAAFAKALQSAKSIAYASEGTSGAYFTGLLERLGIAEAVKPRLVPVAGGETATAVARGEAELAVVPVTSILAAAPGVTLAGRFPPELQSYIDFSIGVAEDAANKQAARDLSDYLRSADAGQILANWGVERPVS